MGHVPGKRKGTLVSTLMTVAPSLLYPLRFQITGGPTHTRIADAAKYYHDPDVDFPIYLRGILTDTRIGQGRTIKLKVYPYGYWAGTDFKDGWMHVFLTIPGYFQRFGPEITYNHRKPKLTEVILELSKQSEYPDTRSTKLH
jgi:hypothetical protein